MKKILLSLGLLLALAACKKGSTDEEEPNTGNNNNNGNGSFTPPTSDYWKIRDSAFTGSADAVQVNISGSDMALAKRFSALGYNYCHLRVFFNGSPEPQIRNMVPEGGSISFPITRTQYTGGDSLHVEFDVDDMNPATMGNYFFRATGGRIFISKRNGKLRYSSNGTLQAEGVKYPNMQSYIYQSTTNFSLEQP